MGFTEGQRNPPDASELNNPRIEEVCRRYADLRYRLMPYTYTLAWEARATGMPLMRAMWLHYPEDERARGLEYLKGEATWTRLTWVESEGRLIIEPGGPEGASMLEAARVFRVEIVPEGGVKLVTYEGRRVEAKF